MDARKRLKTGKIWPSINFLLRQHFLCWWAWNTVCLTSSWEMCGILIHGPWIMGLKLLAINPRSTSIFSIINFLSIVRFLPLEYISERLKNGWSQTISFRPNFLISKYSHIINFQSCCLFVKITTRPAEAWDRLNGSLHYKRTIEEKSFPKYIIYTSSVCRSGNTFFVLKYVLSFIFK